MQLVLGADGVCIRCIVNNSVFAVGELNIGEYSPMISEPEANNCLSIIFRGEYQELQNNGLKHKKTDAIIRVHAHM